MRKIIILGTLAALFGFTALAQASDQSRAEIRDATEVTRAAANDSRGDRHEGGDTRSERSHRRDDGSDAKRKEAREGHHQDEPAEHRDRR